MISNILFDNANEKMSNTKYQEVQTDKIDFELTETIQTNLMDLIEEEKLSKQLDSKDISRDIGRISSLHHLSTSEWHLLSAFVYKTKSKFYKPNEHIFDIIQQYANNFGHATELPPLKKISWSRKASKRIIMVSPSTIWQNFSSHIQPHPQIPSDYSSRG